VTNATTTNATVEARNLRPLDKARASSGEAFRTVISTWEFFTDEGGFQSGVRFTNGDTCSTHRTWIWELA
jgi:hypothetical protein